MSLNMDRWRMRAALFRIPMRGYELQSITYRAFELAGSESP